jgi:hypothetical protein
LAFVVIGRRNPGGARGCDDGELIVSSEDELDGERSGR